MYDEFMGEFGGERAHKYLHTHFSDRKRKQF
jgi:hypothetical protein